jgi:prohibitin 2
LVEQAEQEKKSTIIKAVGEARSAEAFGRALAENPAYIDLKRIEAA